MRLTKRLAPFAIAALMLLAISCRSNQTAPKAGPSTVDYVAPTPAAKPDPKPAAVAKAVATPAPAGKPAPQPVVAPAPAPVVEATPAPAPVVVEATPAPTPAAAPEAKPAKIEPAAPVKPLTIAEMMALPVGENVVEHSDIKYKEGDDVHERHILDLYLPKNVKDFPVVFFVHGGAWYMGEKRHGKAIARGVANKGWGVVSINYRLAAMAGNGTQYPHFCEDAAAAFAWTHKHIAEYGGDPKRIFVAGHSAGGHIGACISYNEKFLNAHSLKNTEVVKGFIGLSGVYDIPALSAADPFEMLAAQYMSFAFPADDASRKEASPSNYTTAGDPPAMIFWCKEGELLGIDKTNRNFVAKLKDTKIPYRMRVVEGRTHETIMREFGTENDTVEAAAFAFLEDVLEGKPITEPEAAAETPAPGAPAKPAEPAKAEPEAAGKAAPVAPAPKA
jgi:acetyl esterase/lipase